MTANLIENPTVGFKGYKLSIPPGFEIADTKRADLSSNPMIKTGSRLWNDFMDEEMGVMGHFHFVESFFIYNKDAAFLFFAGCLNTKGVSLSHKELRRELKKQLGLRVEHQVKRFEKDGMQGVKGDVLQEKGGRVGITLAADAMPIPMAKGEAYCGEIYMIFGDLNETFLLVGIANSKDQEKMRSTWRRLIQDLRF